MISVLLATYNGQRYLEPLLDSLLVQTRHPAELIVCDDASTDLTMSIVERFAQHAPFVVKILRGNGKPLGYAENFLRGIVHCSSPFIAFCDQDDVWVPQKVERVAAVIEKHGCDAVVHRGRVVDVELKWQGQYFPNLPLFANGWWCPDRFFLTPGFAMVVSKSLLISVAPELRPDSWVGNTNSPLPHDLWAYFLARNLGSVSFIRDVLVQYRQHASNVCGAGKTGVRNTVSLARQADSNTYIEKQAQCVRYSAYLRSIADSLSDAQRQHCERSAQWYEQLAAAFESRVVLYDAKSGLQKAARFGANALSGRYRSRHRGGLGYKSLVKDLMVTAKECLSMSF